MRNSLLLLLLLPLLMGAGRRHEMFSSDGPVVIPTVGTQVSMTVSQIEADYGNSPIIRLSAMTTDAVDIYVEGRCWSQPTLTYFYEIYNAEWVSEVFGWELVQALDGAVNTTHVYTWDVGMDAIDDYHMAGDMGYQMRFRYLDSSGLSKWYTSTPQFVVDPAADTTPPSNIGVLTVGGVVYDPPTIIGNETYYGKFVLQGLQPSDAGWGTLGGAQARVNYGNGYAYGQWMHASWLAGGQITVNITEASVDDLITTYGTDFDLEYRMVDGSGNVSSWATESGDMLDMTCDWDQQPDVLVGTNIAATCYEGVGVTVGITGSTLPCSMSIEIRGRESGGDWYTSSPTNTGTFHSISVFVMMATCVDVEVQYRVSDGSHTTDWTAAGTFTPQ